MFKPNRLVRLTKEEEALRQKNLAALGQTTVAEPTTEKQKAELAATGSFTAAPTTPTTIQGALDQAVEDKSAVLTERGERQELGRELGSTPGAISLLGETSAERIQRENREETERLRTGKILSAEQQAIQDARLAAQRRASETSIAAVKSAFTQSLEAPRTSTAPLIAAGFSERTRAVIDRAGQAQRIANEQRAALVKEQEKARDRNQAARVKSLQAEIDQASARAAQAEKDVLAETRRGAAEARDITAAQEKQAQSQIDFASSSPAFAASLTPEAAGQLFIEAGSTASAGIAWQSINSQLNEELQKGTKADPEIVQSLRAQLGTVKAESQTTAQKNIAAFRGLLDAGTITQEQFNKAIEGQLGIADKSPASNTSPRSVPTTPNGFSPSPEGGFRTDRHNNPTAIMFEGFNKMLGQIGYTEGVDFSQGDAFPENPNLHTIRFNSPEEGIQAAKDIIDNFSFFTASGQQRWTHTALSQSQWNALTDDQKTDVVKNMYRSEGGNGSLFGEEAEAGKFTPEVEALIDGSVNGFISSTEFTAGIKQFDEAQRTEIIAEKAQRASVSGGTPDEKRVVTQVMRQLPTKLKDSILEKKERQQEILNDIRAGRNVQDIVDELKGFLITNNEEFELAKGLRALATGTDLPLGELSAAINLNQPVKAMTIVENANIDTIGGALSSTVTARGLIKSANNAERLLAGAAPEALGAWDGFTFPVQRQVGGVNLTEDQVNATQRLSTALTILFKDLRRESAGTAVTESELLFLEPLIADIKDQPNIIAIKLDELKNGIVRENNAVRETLNLPTVNELQLLDNNERLKLYRPSRGFFKTAQAAVGDDVQLFTASPNVSQEDIDLYNNLNNPTNG